MSDSLFNSYETLKLFSECKGQYVSASETDEIKKYLRKKEYYNENLLRVAMIGRTNAGKSKLTNALIGQNIAPVSGKELTSWNTCFWPSDRDYCLVTFKDGGIEQMTTEHYSFLISNPENRDSFLRNVSDIDIFYKTDDVNFAIMDIPGLFTDKTENEEQAFSALMDADAVLFVVPGDTTLTVQEKEIYNQIIKREKPCETVLTKSDEYDDDELDYVKSNLARELNVQADAARKSGIRENSPACKEIFNISSVNCLRGDEKELANRKKLVDALNSKTVCNRQLRRQQHVVREIECLEKMQAVCTRVIKDIDKAFASKYEAHFRLYLKSDEVMHEIRREFDDSVKDYCRPYRQQIINAMVSASPEELKEGLQNVICDTVPEEYLKDFWRDILVKAFDKIYELWDMEKRELPDVNGYIREIMKRAKSIQVNPGSGITPFNAAAGTSVGIGAALSFFEAVLGPEAASVSLVSALSGVGVPIALLGTAIGCYFLNKHKGSEKLSAKEAEKILDDILTLQSREAYFSLLGKLEEKNGTLIQNGIKAQEKELKSKLPDGMEDADTALDVLERTNSFISNSWTKLFFESEFYRNYPDGITDVKYVDPVEEAACTFLKKVDGLPGNSCIDTSNVLPFMPVLLLSDENRAKLLDSLGEMCRDIVSVNSRLDKKCPSFRGTYILDEDAYSVYYTYKGKKQIQVNYIDARVRDEDRQKKYGSRILDGNVLADVHLKRKLLSDISSARNSVDILLPWLSESIKSRPKYYERSVLDALLIALKNGAKVTLGVGNKREINRNRSTNISSERDNEANTKKITAMLQNESPFCEYFKSGRLVIHTNSYTHEKMMAIDNIKAYCGSFNFASNTGEFDLVTDTGRTKKPDGRSGAEHPGESMDIKDNILGVAKVLERIKDKYNE